MEEELVIDLEFVKQVMREVSWTEKRMKLYNMLWSGLYTKYYTEAPIDTSNHIYELQRMYDCVDSYSPYTVTTTAMFTPKRTKKKRKSKHI